MSVVGHKIYEIHCSSQLITNRCIILISVTFYGIPVFLKIYENIIVLY
jgi:hypothetical protein